MSQGEDDMDARDIEAEQAYFRATGRMLQARHESGTVWAIRSLDIPADSLAIVAYAKRKHDGTWEIFRLPPKTRWGTFA